MEDGLFTKQGKKLLMVGIFLFLVAALVGREEDPGVIAGLAEDGSAVVSADTGAAPIPAPPSAAMMQRPAPAPRREDPNLSAWYAQADTGSAVDPEPITPAPIDNSHLVNDARPIAQPVPIG